MSHELRTPLNAIFGISTLLRLSRLDNTQTTYVEKLEASTRHMLQLVGNILDIKKIENKNFQLDIEQFKLNSVKTAVNDILTSQAESKGLHLNFTGWESITASLYGDKLRLTQILINLLNNAIKFTEFGSVTLSVQQLASATPGIVCLHFAVTDTGVGISPDKLPYLFQPFMQLKKRPNSFKDGAGLGLAISKNLVEMMGGTLAVKSSPGLGSEFSFILSFGMHDRRSNLVGLADRRKYRGVHGRRYSLRMQDRRNSLKAYDRRKSQSEETFTLNANLLLSTGTRVLLVDDYDLNLFVGQKLLASIGGEVAVAANGQSAIMQLQRHQFDIILLDLSMADMDGFEVATWIRRYGQQPNIPIIALTAQATPAIEQQCREAGMNDFLTKPFTLQDLHTVIVKNVHKTLSI
jgi:CheY-like chemotaxis protein